MNRFTDIALKLGWEQVQPGMMVFRTIKLRDTGTRLINFVTCKSYDNFDLDDPRITEEFVKNYILAIGCSNVYKQEFSKWVEPMMISDYFNHRGDRDKSGEWAEVAMANNSKLRQKDFFK